MNEEREVLSGQRTIRYLLERKDVKNVNLRIHQDGKVYVSAKPSIAASLVDQFVLSKAEYICKAQTSFEEQQQYAPAPKHYVSGESFQILGRSLRLEVEQGAKDRITSDGIFLRAQMKDLSDTAKRQRLIEGYLSKMRRETYREILNDLYPAFRKYDIPMPALHIKAMNTRWGSCTPARGVIALNKRLIEAPRHCIEYVIMHELCHLIYADHSKQFYAFLTMQMPDWKERKATLDKTAVYWL